ncbi:transcriptional regulator, LuxR family [Rhizobiales bacterium GAS113]|nr:transcriptional regulator, LuxR family [Rhizobiales bacterium GAS113]
MTLKSMPETGVPLPSGVLAFLLTDVEGSTRRWEAWPGPMSLAVARHDELLRAVMLARGGHIFRTAGDAFYAAFASPAAAIDAALAAQHALAQQDFSEIGGLTVRMAVHAGPVEARESDYFGQGMNRCARLLSIAYGGQVLISGAAADMARGVMPAQSSLLDLGHHRLRDVPEAEQIYQLVAPGLRATFPTLRSLGAKVHNLPRQLPSFVRRDTEVAEIKARLAHYRLVTLTGSGGAGKTRMALEVGSDLLADTLDGVWFVELAPLDDPQLVAETLCSTIGVPVGGSRSATESAVGYLRQKNALLILDNCEHLIDAAARLVEALVRDCPSLLVLDTSRERLEIPGENTYRVPSLGVPPLVRDLTASAALEYDAVRLFVERAGATVEGFALTDANAAAVANICRQLDGIPMAIELAVPQLRMLPPKGLEARLQDRFLLLVKGSRTALPRHQTLRTVFDWSYNLLRESERTLFRRLSVFVGGWTLEAAIAVASGGAVEAQEIFGLVSGLVDKSLVVADLATSEPRYKYLQTTRQYGAEKLRESGERGLRRHLAEYMIRLFAEASAAWPTMATESWLAKYEPDLDNLRASLDWAFGPQGDAGLGVELTSHSLRVWDELSLLSERERWFATALEHKDANTPSTTLARLWLGRTSNSAHGARTNLDPALAAADLFRKAGDRLGLGEALAKAGAALETPETTAQALPYLDEALEVLIPLGPTKHLASCLRSLAVARYFVSDFVGARALIAQSEAVARSLGDGRGIAGVQIAAAELEFAAGAVDEAIAQVKNMLAGAHHNRRQLTLGLGNLASYLLAAGRTSEAKATALEGLGEARALVWHAAVVRLVEHLALVAALGSKAETAARLLGFGVAFYAGGTASREFTEISSYERLTAELAKQLPKERVAELMAEGALWSEDRALAVATSI